MQPVCHIAIRGTSWGFSFLFIYFFFCRKSQRNTRHLSLSFLINALSAVLDFQGTSPPGVNKLRLPRLGGAVSAVHEIHENNVTKFSTSYMQKPVRTPLREKHTQKHPLIPYAGDCVFVPRARPDARTVVSRSRGWERNTKLSVLTAWQRLSDIPSSEKKKTARLCFPRLLS